MGRRKPQPCQFTKRNGTTVLRAVEIDSTLHVAYGPLALLDSSTSGAAAMADAVVARMDAERCGHLLAILVARARFDAIESSDLGAQRVVMQSP